MRLRVAAVALTLGALAATPCLALTVQTAPPSAEVAQHLRSSTGPMSGALPGPGQLQGSFVASGRPQLGSGFTGAPSVGATGSSFGPFRATTAVTPGFSDTSTDMRRRDEQNPLSLTPPRR